MERAKIQGDGNATHRCSHGGHGRWPENFRVRAGLDQEIREEPTRLSGSNHHRLVARCDLDLQLNRRELVEGKLYRKPMKALYSGVQIMTCKSALNHQSSDSLICNIYTHNT